MQLTEKSQQVLVQECHQVFVVHRNSITVALEAVYLGQLYKVYKEARSCCAGDDASKAVRARDKQVGKHIAQHAHTEGKGDTGHMHSRAEITLVEGSITSTLRMH